VQDSAGHCLTISSNYFLSWRFHYKHAVIVGRCSWEDKRWIYCLVWFCLQHAINLSFSPLGGHFPSYPAWHSFYKFHCRAFSAFATPLSTLQTTCSIPPGWFCVWRRSYLPRCSAAPGALAARAALLHACAFTAPCATGNTRGRYAMPFTRPARHFALAPSAAVHTMTHYRRGQRARHLPPPSIRAALRGGDHHFAALCRCRMDHVAGVVLAPPWVISPFALVFRQSLYSNTFMAQHRILRRLPFNAALVLRRLLSLCLRRLEGDTHAAVLLDPRPTPALGGGSGNHRCWLSAALANTSVKRCDLLSSSCALPFCAARTPLTAAFRTAGEKGSTSPTGSGICHASPSTFSAYNSGTVVPAATHA